MAATGNTTIQMTVPDHLRGRVMSVYTTVFAGSTPIGGLLTGVLASAISVPFAIAVGGAGSLVVGVAAYAWYRRMAPAMADLPVAIPPAATALGAESPTGLSGPEPAGTAAGGAPTAVRRSTARG
jgi:hypothetical protein